MDLTPILLQYLSSEETYSMTKDIKLRVLYGDKQHIKNVLQTLSKLISQDQQPIVRLLALRFNKELAETFHEEYIHLMQKIMLPKMEEILIANKNIYQEDRGKSLFLNNQKLDQNNKQLQLMGEQFYRIALECIWIWAKWFPLDKVGQKLSIYRVTMEKLVKIGIQFPKIQYFDLDNVYKNLPQSLPPLPMIIQLRELLKQKINLPTKQLCHHLTMNHSLLIFDSKYHTYGEMLQKVVLHSALVRTKKSKMTSIIIEEKNQKQLQVNIIDDNLEGKLEAMLIEKQQLENMNNCYQQRNMELQKQLIQSQNQSVIQAKEIEISQKLIVQSQSESATLLIKFNQLVEQYEKFQKAHNSTYLNAQFEQELVAFRTQYEYIQNEYEIKKLQQENILLTEQKNECEDQIDKLQREKQSLAEENILLQKREMQLIKKKYQGSTTSIPHKSNYDPILQINQLKSQLVQYEQQIIQLKAQISLLKDHISKFDKKNSSTFGSSTQSCNTILFNNRIAASALQSSQKNLKPIQTTPLIEYNPTIFSIHPNAFNLKFRQACLNSKAILYNDEIIQIGVQTTLKQQLLLITLGIQNKSNFDFQQLELKLPPIAELQVFQYNELSSTIKPKDQALVKLQLQILKSVYQLQEFKLKFKYQQQENVIDLCLPCTINKFFKFQPLPDQLPSIYFYSGMKFPTGFQNQFEQLLPEFSIRKLNETEIEALGRIDIDKKQLIVLIQSKRSIMQIKITGEYQDKLAETIISTYQGLFIKR